MQAVHVVNMTSDPGPVSPSGSNQSGPGPQLPGGRGPLAFIAHQDSTAEIDEALGKWHRSLEKMTKPLIFNLHT